MRGDFPLPVAEAAMKELAALVRSRGLVAQNVIRELEMIADVHVEITWVAHQFEGPDLYSVTKLVLT